MCQLDLKAEGQRVPCLYFDEPGEINTEATLKRAAIRAGELNVRQVVVASASGQTALKAAEIFRDCRLVAVTHSTGFGRPDFQEMPEDVRRQLEQKGVKVLTCQHAFGGVNRAVRKRLGTYELDEIIAYTLRIFGEGMKVAIEVSLMAADAGLIQTGLPCVAIGGTEKGVDTAILLKPANAQNFFDLRVMEILARPGFYHYEGLKQ
ncbi:MAG: pyruvate kinase alpha/beta domain-containing protein [Candidatus Saccharicenans sp.]|nr:pyruvate kinase alpha/beta domain-containing protein [Candidatus Saccharicenans sp.]